MRGKNVFMESLIGHGISHIFGSDTPKPLTQISSERSMFVSGTSLFGSQYS